MTDFNMLNILKKFNSVEKKNLNESAIAECGMDASALAAPKTPMSINISGDAGDIATMLKTLSGIESKPAMMAMDLPMDMPKIPGEGASNRPDEAYMDAEELMAGGNDIHAEKAPEDIRVKDNAISHEIRDEEIEEWDNEPDEEYADHSMMLDKLSGGLNNKKKMYKAAQPGDNAMAVESIKNRLLKALAEAKKSKPDFLDVDKDGDKKEPMKKAIADKKKKTNEAEVQVPNHELSDLSRKASSMAQKIKRKINSGEQMDDRDYNQMAELGSVLSRVGASFGPKSMKDVMTHMVQYTDDRNQEGHGYPEFTVDRFKELLAMAKSTGESMVGEISPDLAKRYTKNAKVDRDNTDHILKRDGSANDWKTNQELQKRNSKRTKGINLAKKRM